MGNAITANVNLDHEVYHQQEGEMKVNCPRRKLEMRNAERMSDLTVNVAPNPFLSLAIEAGQTLLGKVVIQVQATLKPCDLTIEVNGKEKTTAVEDGRTM